MSDPTFRCWCCGQVTLAEEPNGSYEICGTCGWEDDRVTNGGKVAWRVSAEGTTVRIWMKHWEQGEPEPDFPQDACAG